MLRRIALLVVTVAVFVCGCGSDDTLEASLDSEALADLEAKARTHFDYIYDVYPDMDARYADFADDAVAYDPTFGDYWVSRDQIISGWDAAMPTFFPDLDAEVTTLFLSETDASYAVDWINFWLGAKPEGQPWPQGIETYRFDGDTVTGYDFLYTGDSLYAMHVGACEETDCAVKAEGIANQYVDAWNSLNTDSIAALYATDATFSDTMFGLSASGATEIGNLLSSRFGSGEASMTVDTAYIMTVDGSLVTGDSPAAAGDIAGVGIHHTWNAESADGPAQVESLTLLRFGEVIDGKYQPHPEALVVSEELFHTPSTVSTFTVP
jgi:ketosteroid isomerase-like protein